MGRESLVRGERDVAGIVGAVQPQGGSLRVGEAGPNGVGLVLVPDQVGIGASFEVERLAGYGGRNGQGQDKHVPEHVVGWLWSAGRLRIK